MDTNQPAGLPSGSAASSAAKPFYAIVAGIVALQGLVIEGLAVWLAVDIATGQSRSLATAIALTVLVLAAGSWLLLIARRLLKQERWARSAAIFCQTCMLAVASASFTGRGANLAIGLALAIPALAAIGLLFSRPVVRAVKASLDAN